MSVSSPVRTRSRARVSAGSERPPQQQPWQQPWRPDRQVCFRDRRQRVIWGTPDPAPCAFCDRRDALVIAAGLEAVRTAARYHVTCGHCGAEGPQAPSRRAAAALWNTLGVTAEQRFYRLLCGPGEG